MFHTSRGGHITNERFQTFLGCVGVALWLVAGASCAHQSQTRNGEMASNAASASEEVALKKIPAGKEFSGFLKDYSPLKPNPNLDGNAFTFVRSDEGKNLHKYIAIIVDPVQVYLASDADESKLPEKAPGAGARYFHKALAGAVSSAFPVVDQPGPLVCACGQPLWEWMWGVKSRAPTDLRMPMRRLTVPLTLERWASKWNW